MRRSGLPQNYNSSRSALDRGEGAGSLAPWDYAALEEGRGGHRLSALAEQVPPAAYVPVTPNRTTRLGGSWPCEQVAAAVENKASFAIAMDRYDEVCARMMQSQQNTKFISGVASAELAVVFMNVFLASSLQPLSIQERLPHGVAAVVGAASFFTHTGVFLQFERVKKACERALTTRFGEPFVKQLDALSRDEQGFEKAIELLREHGSSTNFLDEKLAEYRASGGPHRSWVAQMLMSLGGLGR